MRLPITLASFVLLAASHAATADTARTVDFTQQVANPTGGQCPQRTAHYFIAAGGDGAGMLSIASQWSCSASSGNASIGVCQVDQTLKCRTDIQFRDKSCNPIDLSGYAVTLKGVTARGEFHPWGPPRRRAHHQGHRERCPLCGGEGPGGAREPRRRGELPSAADGEHVPLRPGPGRRPAADRRG